MAPDPIAVDDPQDPRLVEVAGLTDAHARAHTESEHGCFVVEGLLSLRAAIASPYPLRSVLVSERKLARVLPLLREIDVAVFVASQAIVEEITGFPIHRGVVASAARLPLPGAGEVLQDAQQVLVVAGVNDHENLGALFRNAAAFGIDAVLLDPTAADPLYRRSVRVSLGHVLTVPWTRIGALPGALDALTGSWTTVALTPAGEEDVRALPQMERTAWIVGPEGPGLGAETMQAAAHRARIAMATDVDSLNVATAAAVAFALSRPAR